MTRVNLIATRDFSYRTRRLKAGDDILDVPEREARILIAIKKAQYGRVPGRVAPPPPEVQQRIGTATPTADDAFAAFLDRPIATIGEDLAGIDDAQLRAYQTAEKAGKNRKGLVGAIDAELESRKG